MTDATDGQPARGNPYIGPRAFGRGETIYGRDRELQRLVHLLIAERIVVLYSPSGAGKTSLIQAGLVPRLEQDAFVVLPVVRVGLEPPVFGADGRSSEITPNRYVQSVILSLEEGQPPDQRVPLNELASLDLPTYLDRRCTSAGDDGTTEWVLVFDQFEEILTMDPTDEDAKAAFFAQVGAALRDRRFWALFALREDYLAGLDPYLRPIPTRLHTTFRLDLLGPEAARLAIQQPARAAGVEFQDAAAERLIDDLRRVRVQQLNGGMLDQLGTDVEPVQLQVVCRRLWERLPPATPRIVESDMEAVGDVDQALSGYYAERVAGVATETAISERAIREWVDDQLITEQGIRGQVLQGQDESEGLPNAAILALVDAHLVRAERRRGFTWFELAHDRLIGPVRADNATWFERNLSDLQRQAALWERHDRQPELLLRGNAYRDVVSWASVHDTELTSVERDFLSAARELDEAAARDRRRVQWIQRLAVGAALLALLTTGMSAVAWYKTEVADRLTVKANEAAADANAAADEAKRQRDIATQQTQIAEQQTRIAEQQKQTATLRGLVSEARGLFHSRLDQALLVSLEAIKQSDTPETRGTLLDALDAEPRLDTVLVGHTKRVLGLAFMGGGHGLVSASLDNTIRTWSDPDALPGQSGQQSITPTNALDGARLIAFSPDGAYAATVTGRPSSPSIRLWSVQQKDELAQWESGQRVDALAFSRDSALLGAVGPDPTDSSTPRVELWNLPDVIDCARSTTTCQPSSMLGPAPGAGNSGAANWPSLAFGNDQNGPLVAFGANNADVVLVRPNDSDRRYQILKTPIQLAVTSLAFSPDGRYLVEGTSGATLFRWDLGAGSTSQPLMLRGHKFGVTSIAFDPQRTSPPLRQELFATASVDGTVILWDVATGQPFATPLAGHPSQIDAIAFSPDGEKLASAGLDGPIRVWNVPTKSAAFTANAAPLGTRLQNPTTGFGMIALAFDAGGERVAGVYGTDSSVVVWSGSNGSPIAPPIPAQSGTVADLAFSPNGQALATAGCATPARPSCRQGIVRFWNAATDVPTRESLTVDGAALDSLAFSPLNSNLLVAGDAMGRLHFWNLAETPPSQSLQQTAGSKPIQGLRFSEDGKLLASAASDGLFLWQVPDAIQLSDHPLVATSVVPAVGNPKALAISSDGTFLASVGSSDTHAIDVWDVAHGQPGNPALTLTGHLDTVTGLAFIADHQSLTLASVSADATLQLWDVTNSTGAQIGQRLRGYPFGVSSLAYSPTTGRLATTTGAHLSGAPDVQNNLILWQVQPDSWKTIACHMAGHNLSPTTWTQLMGDLPYDTSLCPDEPVIDEGKG